MSCNPEKIALNLTVERIAGNVARKIMLASLKTASNCATVSELIGSFGLDESKNDMDVELTAACSDIRKSFEELSAALKNTDVKNKRWFEIWKDNNVEDLIVSYMLSDDFGKVMKRLSIFAGMGDRLVDYRKSIPELDKQSIEFADANQVKEDKLNEYAKILGIKEVKDKIDGNAVKEYFGNKVGELKKKLERLGVAYDKLDKVLQKSGGFIDGIIKRCDMNQIKKKVKMRGSSNPVPGLQDNGLLASIINSIRGEFVDLKAIIAEIQSNKIGELKSEVENMTKKVDVISGKEYHDILKEGATPAEENKNDNKPAEKNDNQKTEENKEENNTDNKDQKKNDSTEDNNSDQGEVKDDKNQAPDAGAGSGTDTQSGDKNGKGGTGQAAKPKGSGNKTNKSEAPKTDNK